jgi:L,D-peptidoglycan transpeptidase YkuD (ErfK/YbiS/YcfS/YnhG family)
VEVRRNLAKSPWVSHFGHSGERAALSGTPEITVCEVDSAVAPFVLLATWKLAGGQAMPKPVDLMFAAAAILASQVSPVDAATCPGPVAEASRLVLVTTRSMDTARATLQLFTRPSANVSWKRASAAESAVVGEAGLGWGYPFLDFKEGEEPEKVEGDSRTPAGFFRIGASFGFAPSRRPGYIELKSGETVCVEDPSSPLYNTITKRSDIGSVEADDMRSSPLYRSGLFVEYPSDRAGRRGSCIFIHIWSASDVGTAGCVGLPEARVRALQQFSRAGAVLAVLPETALGRFPGCLPAAAIRPAAFTGGNR